MNIEKLVLGSLEVNCYLLTHNGEAIVIDPGAEAEKIIDAIEEKGCTLTKILLTHGHFDHIGAVADLKEKTGAKVYIHSGDREMLSDNTKNLSFMAEGIKLTTADEVLDDITSIPLADTEVKVHFTPGHSKGGVSFLWGDNLFAGDLLFKNSIGRFDHGSLRVELMSLKYLMETFEDSVKVYPGHGPSTTIGEERENNPYIINHVLR